MTTVCCITGRCFTCRFFLFGSLVRFNDSLEISHGWTIDGEEWRWTNRIGCHWWIAGSRRGFLPIVEVRMSLEESDWLSNERDEEISLKYSIDWKDWEVLVDRDDRCDTTECQWNHLCLNATDHQREIVSTAIVNYESRLVQREKKQGVRLDRLTMNPSERNHRFVFELLVRRHPLSSHQRLPSLTVLFHVRPSCSTGVPRMRHYSHGLSMSAPRRDQSERCCSGLKQWSTRWIYRGYWWMWPAWEKIDG